MTGGLRRLLTVAEMALRELIRRRTVLVLLLVLPLAFYLIRRDQYVGQSVRSLFVGIGWTVSTAALFSTIGARSFEPRLRMAGYRSHELYLGRLCGLWTLGVALAAPFLALVRFDVANVRYGAVGVAMLCVVTVAAPFGMLIGHIIPREMEGTLALLTVVAIQMLIDPASTASKLTPFWSSREIGTYAIDHTGADYLQRGLVHAAVSTLLLLALVAVVSATRLRRRVRVLQRVA
ncbi:MAG TPA: hypothetical protein VH561_22680 [Micromonosporaceae bacterium]